ncbi:MAG: FecR domain-containing protein [Bacteroidia bacterium]
MRLYDLAERHLNGTLNHSERSELDLWLAASEENRAEFSEIIEVLGFADAFVAEVEPQTDAEWVALQARIAVPQVEQARPQPVAASRPLIRPPFYARRRVWAVAAAVALLVTVGGYFALGGGSADEAQKGQHFAAADGQRKEIKLTDGTVVTLQGGSTLDAAADFGKQDRKLELNGEAYFDVARDEARPLSVRMGQVQARVLGTEFNLRSEKTSTAVQLSVTEGKVEFSATNGAKEILVAGEVAHFDPKTGKIVREQTNAQEEAAWVHDALIFNDKPFVEAAGQIERHYGITLKFPESLNAARLTAKFEEKPLADVLAVLEALYGVSASQSGTVVTLSK